MPICNTRHFGRKSYEENAVLRMARGPIGFEDESAFVLIQIPEQFPLVYLQSTRTPGLCFLALPVLTINREYRVLLTAEDATLIGVTREPRIGEEVLCLALITTAESGASANLLAPVVVNLRSQQALQCINGAGSYAVRHFLCPEAEGVAA